MTVLPDTAIMRMGKELVDPFVPEHVQPASIDLCLHNEFIIFDSHKGLFIDLDQVHDDSARKIVKGEGKGFILHPGEFILGATMEKVSCPNNIVARLEGKSSLGRLGILIHVTAGFVDPGWHGRLTLEILNVRKVPIILRPGLPFCQISFQYMAGPASKPYAGKYQGDEGVSVSRYGQGLVPTNTIADGEISKSDAIIRDKK
jgi:dCTP deaminase